MSHDTDKLIRQLSLVAFLMAERRPLTARDVKQNVEGYQEMSDEAFARRFYSDRAELHAPGYSPELPGRLAKLEGAISKSRTLKFEYWSIMRQEQRERTVNPYALLFDRGQWYVIGLDLEDER